jgi:hypothetical protein
MAVSEFAQTMVIVVGVIFLLATMAAVALGLL